MTPEEIELFKWQTRNTIELCQVESIVAPKRPLVETILLIVVGVWMHMIWVWVFP